MNDLKQAVEHALSENYQNFRFFKRGGTRALFLTDWGPAHEQRVAKIDAPPEGPRAQRHVSRGCTTERDLQALSKIQNPELHNLIRLCDYAKKEGKIITVETFFPSESLEERAARAPLEEKEFKEVFGKVIDGLSYLVKHAGLYHRDLKPSNILVDELNQVRITDFANATGKDRLEEKFLPTAGGHHVMDPRIMGWLTGEKRAYDEQAEIYALHTTMYYALTGEYPFEYDPDNKTAEANGKSLIEDGKWNTEKHEQALREALKKVPRKLRNMLFRGLTSRESNRYSSIDEMVQDWERATAPSILKSCMSVLIKPATVAVATLSFLGATALVANEYDQPPVPEKFKVATSWDGTSLEMKNNYIDLEVSVRPEYKKDEPRQQGYPERKYIQADPGEQIDVFLRGRSLPRPSEFNKMMTFAGRSYIEGHPGKRFTVNPLPYDESAAYMDWHAGHGTSAYINIAVPDMPEGTYILATELYAPADRDNIEFPKTGNMIFRKRVPIVIGNPPDRASLDRVIIEQWPQGALHLGINSLPEEGEHFGNTLSKKYTCNIIMDGWEHEAKPVTGRTNSLTPRNIHLPECPEGIYTIQFLMMHGNEPVGYTALPLLRKKEHSFKGEAVYHWELAHPGDEWGKQLTELHKKLFQHKPE